MTLLLGLTDGLSSSAQAANVPSVAFTSVNTGDTLAGRVTLDYSVNSTNFIPEKLCLKIDGQPIVNFEDYSPQLNSDGCTYFTYVHTFPLALSESFESVRLSNGTHTISAYVYDYWQRSSSLTEVAVTIANTSIDFDPILTRRQLNTQEVYLDWHFADGLPVAIQSCEWKVDGRSLNTAVCSDEQQSTSAITYSDSMLYPFGVGNHNAQVKLVFANGFTFETSQDFEVLRNLPTKQSTDLSLRCPDVARSNKITCTVSSSNSNSAQGVLRAAAMYKTSGRWQVTSTFNLSVNGSKKVIFPHPDTDALFLKVVATTADGSVTSDIAEFDRQYATFLAFLKGRTRLTWKDYSSSIRFFGLQADGMYVAKDPSGIGCTLITYSRGGNPYTDIRNANLPTLPILKFKAGFSYGLGYPVVIEYGKKTSRCYKAMVKLVSG